MPLLLDHRGLGHEVEEHGEPVADPRVEPHQVEHLPQVLHQSELSIVRFQPISAHLGDADDHDEDGEAEQGHAEPDVAAHQQPLEPGLSLRLLNLLRSKGECPEPKNNLINASKFRPNTGRK